MIYIILALSSEAKPLIHHYKLKAVKESVISLFTNKDILLCITQMGFENVSLTIEKLCEYQKPQENDILINIGLCGAPSQYKIGSLLMIDELRYKSQRQKLSLHVNHSFKTSPLTTVTKAQRNSFETPVDMEAFALFQSASKCITNERIFFIKIVSDHFEPETLNKNLAYGLINRQIKNISTLISNLQRNQQCQQQ
jgi:nucleoside phosphorylase